jgi:hypothetical protein
MGSSSDQGGRSNDKPDVPSQPVVSTTVGTGSVLGLGCVVAVVVLVLVAVAIRWFGGGW